MSGVTMGDLIAQRAATDATLAEGFIVEDIEAPAEEVESSDSEDGAEATTTNPEETDEADQGPDRIGILSDVAVEKALADSIRRPLPRPRQEPNEVEEDQASEAGRRGPTEWNPETPASQFEEAVRYGGDRPRSVREAAKRRAARPIRFD